MNTSKNVMKKWILMFAVLGMSFVFLSACNKQEKPIQVDREIVKTWWVKTWWVVEENKKSEEQTLVEDFALKIGEKEEHIIQTTVKFPSLKGEISEIESFEIENKQYPRDKYQDIEKMFTNWNMYMPADWVWESIVWYLKDDKVCKLHTLLNATKEEIDNDDLEGKDYTVSISCGKNNKKDKKEKQKKEDLEESIILKNILKKFEIQDSEWAIPTAFLWDKDKKTHTVDWYKINLKNSDKVFELNNFWWIENTENSTNQEKLVIKWFEKNENVCLVNYYITEWSPKVWAYADIILSCGKFDKINAVDKGGECENFLKDLFYTSVETEYYIRELNEQKVKNSESGIWLIDYIFEQENPELSSGIYYVLKEIHRDSKDWETRELATRHYKFNPVDTTIYEYVADYDSYEQMTPKEKYLDLYKENCLLKNKDKKVE